MSERDDLLVNLQRLLIVYNIPPEELRAKLFLTLEPYEISKRSTELVVADEETTDRYIKLFLINKRVAGRTDRTLQHYQSTLRKYFREIPKLPTEVTADDLKRYFALKEVRDHVQKVTIKNDMRVLQSFYQWMLREEYIVRNPFNKVDDIKLPKSKKQAFTEMDIERLRSNIPENDIRLQLVFEMLLSTWCRVSELTDVKLSDISENKDSVIVHGKGQKDRICYLNAKTKLLLEKYLLKRTDNNIYLFPRTKDGIASLNRRLPKAELCNWWQFPENVGEGHLDKGTVEVMIRELGRKAGVEKTHPHRFRRTGATLALRRGMPIEQVSKLLGHESIETTQIYLDISEMELEQSHRKYV